MIQRIKNIFRSTENQSDGYHTFKELYSHRDALFLNLCLLNPEKAWWSYHHSDGTEAFGYPWVVVGMGTEPYKQITYHINTKEFGHWENFAGKIKKVDFAPTFDRHSSNDVVWRLKTLQVR